MTIWGLEGGFELRGGGGKGVGVNGMMKMISVAGFVVGGNDGLQLSIANCPVCPFAHI